MACDQHAIHHHSSQEELTDLVERRKGVRPVFDPLQIWAITVPVPEEMLAMTEDEKSEVLDQHETRPLAPWQRRDRR